MTRGRGGPGVTDAPWYREPYVWMLLAIPLSAVVMGVVVILLAAGGDDRPLLDDYYRPGLEVSREQERDRRARALALSATLIFDGDAGRVRVDLGAWSEHDPPGCLMLRGFHATQANLDWETVLAPIGTGRYAGTLTALAPGKWTLELGTHQWRLVGLARVPGPGSVRLVPRPPG